MAKKRWDFGDNLATCLNCRWIVGSGSGSRSVSVTYAACQEAACRKLPFFIAEFNRIHIFYHMLYKRDKGKILLHYPVHFHFVLGYILYILHGFPQYKATHFYT